MGVIFQKQDIDKISDILGVKPKTNDNSHTWKLIDKTNNKPLVFTLYNKVEFEEGAGSLVSVQTQHGYYELHDCTTFLFFEPDEIIFVNYNEKYLSSLIVGSNCSVNLFSNIKREIINADFSNLDPALLLSAMQLSITENVISS